MTEIQALNIAVTLMEENRERMKSELQDAITHEDWVSVLNLACDLRVTDSKLDIASKVLEKLQRLPG